MPKVIFLSKTTSVCAAAEAFATQLFAGDMAVVKGRVGDPMPSALLTFKGQILLSFLSPWIIPAAVLQPPALLAVNFHPGPPEYPGTGCYNFALYDGVERYGVVAHLMLPKVDTGTIVGCRYFPVTPQETVVSLKNRSMEQLLALFKETASLLASGKPLPAIRDQWKRVPYTRRELNDLCRLEASMSRQEVCRRVRALAFPGAPGAYYELHGIRFEHIARDEESR
ncbi:MAG: hypothetical protein HQL22_07105 [Candidatus Omnitrophica bacterium]|nr:hypothetical protein [Candidatus Omnitrophota bacterium]